MWFTAAPGTDGAEGACGSIRGVAWYWRSSALKLTFLARGLRGAGRVARSTRTSYGGILFSARETLTVAPAPGLLSW